MPRRRKGYPWYGRCWWQCSISWRPGCGLAASLCLVLFLAWARGVKVPGVAVLAAHTTQCFSVLGLTSVSVMILSGLAKAWMLVGGVPALVGTLYGRLLLLKVGLLLPLLGLAMLNLCWIRPQLLAGAAHAAVGVLSSPPHALATPCAGRDRAGWRHPRARRMAWECTTGPACGSSLALRVPRRLAGPVGLDGRQRVARGAAAPDAGEADHGAGVWSRAVCCQPAASALALGRGGWRDDHRHWARPRLPLGDERRVPDHLLASARALPRPALLPRDCTCISNIVLSVMGWPAMVTARQHLASGRDRRT